MLMIKSYIGFFNYQGDITLRLMMLRSMHMQNLIKFHQFIQKILSWNTILTINKGYNSIKNLQKLTHNNPNLDLVKVNAYANFDQIASIF